MSWFTKWLIKSFALLILVCFNFFLEKYLKQHEELFKKYGKWLTVLELAEKIIISILLFRLVYKSLF